MVDPPRIHVWSAVGVFSSLKPGNVFKDCDVCPEMVVVPAGNFMMGSSVSVIKTFGTVEPIS